MSISKQIGNCAINLTFGDLTDMEFEAIVFYAQDNLKLGAGFGNAIAMRGGISIQKELEAAGSLAKTEVLVTKAGKLKSKFIIHANGPKFQEEDTEAKFVKTISNTLKAAEEKGIKQIAFPPMGTGFYCIGLEACAKMMLDAFKDYLRKDSGIKEINIVAMDNREYKPFADKMNSL